MDTRYWHGLDRDVGRMGFGCWQLAGNYEADGRPQGWGAIDRQEAVRLVHMALDGGIEFFDTAPAYGHGASEEILGEAIATSRAGAAAVVCTKLALSEEEERASRLNADFVAKVDASLRRLRSDRVDVLLLHNPADDVRWDAFDTTVLDGLRKAGKIGTYGVSCRSHQGANNVVAHRFGHCVEWVFHLLERRPIDALLPQLEAARMNFIARSPLSRGLLSPRHAYGKTLRFDAHEFRSTLPADWIDWTLAGAATLAPLAGAAGGMARAALRFALSFDGVSAVIPGIRTTAQLEDALGAAFAGAMEPSVLEAIERLTPPFYPRWA